MSSLQGKQYALTYPRCELEKTQALELLKGMEDVVAVVVSRETHAEEDMEGGSGNHLHAFVKFATKRRRTPQSFELEGHHGNVKIAGNVRGWIEYITKEDKTPATFNFDVEECLKKRSTSLTAAAAAAMTAEQLAEVVHPAQYQRAMSGAALARMVTRKHQDLEGPCGVWITGEPGIGKSFAVRSVFRGRLYLKDHSKWWDGYDGEEVVLIDDVHADAAWIVHFLKIWADAYPFNAETKGGMARIRPRWIIVTSNYPLAELGRKRTRDGMEYPDERDVEALRRRFKELEATERETIVPWLMATTSQEDDVEDVDEEPAVKHRPA